MKGKGICSSHWKRHLYINRERETANPLVQGNLEEPRDDSLFYFRKMLMNND